MAVVINPSWVAETFNPVTGQAIPAPQSAGTIIPISKIPDRYLHIYSLTDATNGVNNFFTVFTQTFSGYYKTIATDVNDAILGVEELESVENVYVFLTNDVPAGDTAPTYAPIFVRCLVSEMYFLEQSLMQYITCQQMEQFKAMYANCVADAYISAVGKLTAQVGNIYDIPTMLGQTVESDKDNTMRWILLVMTAYFICQPTMNISTPLEEANKEVTNIIQQLKGGQVSLQEPADYRTDSYVTTPEVVSIRNRYLG